jgi:predicted CopG family antitoxin
MLKYLVEKVENVESIKIKPETKKKLTEIAGMLEKKTGKRVSYDDVINYLIEKRFKDRRTAEKLFGIAKGVNLYEELLNGRKEDENSS